jgi:hypothetical protein
MAIAAAEHPSRIAAATTTMVPTGLAESMLMADASSTDLMKLRLMPTPGPLVQPDPDVERLRSSVAAATGTLIAAASGTPTQTNSTTTMTMLVIVVAPPLARIAASTVMMAAAEFAARIAPTMVAMALATGIEASIVMMAAAEFATGIVASMVMAETLLTGLLRLTTPGPLVQPDWDDVTQHSNRAPSAKIHLPQRYCDPSAALQATRPCPSPRFVELQTLSFASTTNS